LGPVLFNHKWNYINKEGEIEFPNQWFDYCSDFSEGLALVKLNDNEWNYINKEGEIAFPNRRFDGCSDFSEGLARVVINGIFYYINNEGVLFDNNTKDIDILKNLAIDNSIPIRIFKKSI
jgi:hypothetical protein